MKSFVKIIVGFFALGCGAVLVAQDAAPTSDSAFPPPAAPKAAADAAFTPQQVLEALGWDLAQNTGIAALKFNDSEIQAIAKGMAGAAKGQPRAYDPQKIGPEIEKFIKSRQEKVFAPVRQKNGSEAAAFFADIKKNPNVIALPSGLCYEILKPGTGPFPKPDQIVKVHYTGTLINGTVFDTSLQPHQPGGAIEPVEFPLSQVIPGWTEGLQKINKGGKIKLYVPSALAYGDSAAGPIPPGSTLIFEVQLLDIKDAPSK
jgi:FKBP-type peptidyl-prolyl cis-trans isomerase